MKQIVDLVQRARCSCRKISRDDFMDSVLPIVVAFAALSMTIGLTIPVLAKL
jgi:hypothetical protein